MALPPIWVQSWNDTLHLTFPTSLRDSDRPLAGTRAAVFSLRVAVVSLALLATAVSAGELPDRHLTPGAVNEALDQQALLGACHQKGWTRSYRPPVSFTNHLKRLQMRQYGYQDLDPHDYEEDHLIPLCLGGASQDPHNLWPQPRAGQHDAKQKDQLEAKLCHLVCEGRVPLSQAQQDIGRNWIDAYDKYVASGDFGRGTRRNTL